MHLVTSEQAFFEQLDSRRRRRNRLMLRTCLVLLTALQRAAAALVRARQLVDVSNGLYAVAWSEDLVGTLMPHLEQARTMARLLNLDAVQRAQEGDADGALASCGAALNAGRSIGDEPTCISQLVRAACQVGAVSSLERALAQGEPSRAALEKLQ